MPVSVVPKSSQAVSPVVKGTGTRFGGHALVLEDNVIIAHDAGDMLGQLFDGKVMIAGRVSEAMRIIDTDTLAFAILDVNLGNETSWPVAKRLVEAGIPFILATGYGEADDITIDFPNTKLLQKPYSFDMLQNVVTSYFAA